MQIFRRPIFAMALLVAAGLSACQMPPTGIPNQATLVWYGVADAKQNLGDLMPNVSAGQVYVYDQTEKKVIAVRSLSSDRPAPSIDWEAGHEYKVYYFAGADAY